MAVVEFEVFSFKWIAKFNWLRMIKCIIQYIFKYITRINRKNTKSMSVSVCVTVIFFFQRNLQYISTDSDINFFDLFCFCHLESYNWSEIGEWLFLHGKNECKWWEFEGRKHRRAPPNESVFSNYQPTPYVYACASHLRTCETSVFCLFVLIVSCCA